MIFRNQLSVTRRRLHEGVSYRLRTFAGGRLSSYCRPTSIVLSLTERCNARCIHCDIWKNRGKEERPSLLQWQKLIADLREWLGPVQVTFSGGEALLNRDTIQLLAFGSSRGLFMELLTHGFWEDQSRIEKLALALPARVTISLDGIGETHDQVRGRAGFAEKTGRTIDTLKRIRQERHLKLGIRLKTVIMRQNLDDICKVARFAQREDLEVFYQPIEQNYNTSENPAWFTDSETWPSDTEKVVRIVKELRWLKQEGLPIANSYAQLDAMIPYFVNPAVSRVAIQSHTAHELRQVCSALTMLQFQANGDVRVCNGQPAIGNIKSQPIRHIWQNRPRWWEEACCLERRLNNSLQ
ncbi:MAG TPA: radical SAM protein [Pyrinomonadaceae bacterium]|nr:radical SAM protein [Pyrinomonadaceae bacterium]